MATDRARHMISVDNALFEAIEDFRFGYRFQSRTEAAVELIRLGLQSVKEKGYQKSTT